MVYTYIRYNNIENLPLSERFIQGFFFFLNHHNLVNRNMLYIYIYVCISVTSALSCTTRFGDA